MTTVRYFARPVPGTPHRRYYVLGVHAEQTVVRTQMSRPDGVEVPEPPLVRFRAPADPRAVAVPRAREWNPPVVDRTKSCPRCRNTLPAAAFHRREHGRLQSWCRACVTDYQKERST